jgi:hypothetical protein
VFVAEMLGGAAVEKDEEMEREDDGGMAKRPDLNELDALEWAELVQLALDAMQMATASRRHSGGVSRATEENLKKRRRRMIAQIRPSIASMIYIRFANLILGS